jgi:hypothetical protein|tara:strand:+ start:1323 stop:1529 length:207 start_codon:yes stop_codon:yes gene_type:complete
MKHGGKRTGAGRKPAPDGTAKIAYGTKLDPVVVQYLRECDNAAETIETTIKRSKAFREWLRLTNASGE